MTTITAPEVTLPAPHVDVQDRGNATAQFLVVVRQDGDELWLSPEQAETLAVSLSASAALARAEQAMWDGPVA